LRLTYSREFKQNIKTTFMRLNSFEWRESGAYKNVKFVKDAKVN